MKKFEKLLDHLEDTLLSSTTLPFTSITFVNGDRLLNVLDTLRDTLPEEMILAREVIQQQEAILADARNQAVAMLRQAQEQQQHMLSEHTLMQAIQQEANKVRLQLMEKLELEKQEAQEQAVAMLQQAQEQANQLRAEAQHYASYVLQGMESRLQEIQDRVRHSQEHLNDLHVEAVTIQAQTALAQAPSMGGVGLTPPPLVATSSVVGNTGKRQPRAKVASMQAPLMESGSPAEQVQEALALLYGDASKTVPQARGGGSRRRSRR